MLIIVVKDDYDLVNNIITRMTIVYIKTKLRINNTVVGKTYYNIVIFLSVINHVVLVLRTF